MNEILVVIHILAIILNGFYLIGSASLLCVNDELRFKVGAVVQAIVFIYLLYITMVLF